MGYGIWVMGYGIWDMGYGDMGYGIWDEGIWAMGYGLWAVGCGLWGCGSHGALCPQIFLWSLKDNELTGMAFIDTQLYIHQMIRWGQRAPGSPGGKGQQGVTGGQRSPGVTGGQRSPGGSRWIWGGGAVSPVFVVLDFCGFMVPHPIIPWGCGSTIPSFHGFMVLPSHNSMGL